MTDEVLITSTPEDIVTFTQTIDEDVTVTDEIESIVIVEMDPETIIIQEEGSQGPKGEKGDPGSGLITKIAGETISGGKAVVIGGDERVYVFDILNESHYGKLCGIAKQAAVPGTQLQVYTAGEAVEEGSGWQAGQAYYIGANGILTTIAPVAGIVKMIGVGSAQDSILINNGFEIITV